VLLAKLKFLCGTAQLVKLIVTAAVTSRVKKKDKSIPVTGHEGP
jgi:hypothetical protein